MNDFNEMADVLSAIGMNVITADDIERGLALTKASTILHSISCTSHDHTESGCDFYINNSKEKIKWREIALKEAEELSLSIVDYTEHLVACVDLLRRTKDINLLTLVKVINRVQERKPHAVPEVSGSFSSRLAQQVSGKNLSLFPEDHD